MSTWIDLGIGAGIIFVIGIVFGFNNNRINKKQDKEMCETLHNQFQKDLNRGEEQFREIKKELKIHGGLLANLDKNIALLTKNRK